MAYALVATNEQRFIVRVHAVGTILEGTPGYWDERIATPGTVVNLIAYDGISEYLVSEGMKLLEVSDDVKIGDIISTK